MEERPKELKTGIAAKKKMGPALDLEVSWNRIHAMGNQADAPGPQEEEEDLPALPDSEEEEEEQEGGQGLEAQEYREEQGKVYTTKLISLITFFKRVATQQSENQVK